MFVKIYKLFRGLFSNATVPPLLLGILGFSFWIAWHPPMNPSPLPYDRYSIFTQMLGFIWPYVTAAFLLNQISWHFSSTKDLYDVPVSIFLLNVVTVGLGAYLLYLGPLW